MPTLLATLLLCLVFTRCSGIMGGEATCAGPATEIGASPARAAPGETFGLHGEGFYGRFVCNDTGPSCQFRPNGGRPTDGIRVELVQGGRTWSLATVESDEDLTFDIGELEVPADAQTGEATLRATSPRIQAGTIPPRAETPFVVLDEPSGPDDTANST